LPNGGSGATRNATRDALPRHSSFRGALDAAAGGVVILVDAASGTGVKGRYYARSNLPRQWPMPAGACDREAGLRAFRGMVERSRYAEELGFDWVSVSEHHYSPRILTQSLPRLVLPNPLRR
jgi:hypothetical protein